MLSDYEGKCFSVCINPLFYILTVISLCLNIVQCQSDPVCQGQVQRAGYVQGWVDERGVFHPPDTQNISEFI